MSRVLARWVVVVLVFLCALASVACSKAGPAGSSAPATGRVGTVGDGSFESRAAGPPPASEPTLGEAEESAADVVADGSEPRRQSPGLGTSFGEDRHSRVFTARFVRASSDPEVVLALWYDDREGVDTAMRMHGNGAVPRSRVGSGDGDVGLAIFDDSGAMLPAVDVGGRRYAVGEPGQRYILGIENNSADRWEVVASVDGLDVIDGDAASFAKRGYIVDAFSSITIEGWRTSAETVAAFRFGALPESYAARTGQGRNVGVIGVAFFRERGAPRLHDVERRHGADPFPGRFAPPPPRRTL